MTSYEEFFWPKHREYQASKQFCEADWNLAQARVIASAEKPIDGNRHERRKIAAIEKGLRKRLQKEVKP